MTEAGKTVTEISVDSLTELPAADPSLFVPTEEMKARGRAITMAEAQKISVVSGQGGATAHAVCVFGVVTPSGQLAEAHSLQPSDPNSQAAVEAAKQMNFSFPPPLGPQPQQHFVFVIYSSRARSRARRRPLRATSRRMPRPLRPAGPKLFHRW